MIALCRASQTGGAPDAGSVGFFSVRPSVRADEKAAYASAKADYEAGLEGVGLALQAPSRGRASRGGGRVGLALQTAIQVDRASDQPKRLQIRREWQHETFTHGAVRSRDFNCLRVSALAKT